MFESKANTETASSQQTDKKCLPTYWHKRKLAISSSESSPCAVPKRHHRSNTSPSIFSSGKELFCEGLNFFCFFSCLSGDGGGGNSGGGGDDVFLLMIFEEDFVEEC